MGSWLFDGGLIRGGGRRGWELGIEKGFAIVRELGGCRVGGVGIA